MTLNVAWLRNLDAVQHGQRPAIPKGSPWENDYIESFNGKLRDELLKGYLLFVARGSACAVIDLDERARRDGAAAEYIGDATERIDHRLATGGLQLSAQDRGIVELDLSAAARGQDGAGCGVADSVVDRHRGIGPERLDGVRVGDSPSDDQSREVLPSIQSAYKYG